MEFLIDFLVEFILEFLLDGSMELAGSKKAPMILRILAGGVLAAGYSFLLAVGILLLINGIKQMDIALAVVGAIWILLWTVLLVIVIVTATKKRRKGKYER